MDEIISIVIPIYNVEKYINKCIDSILSQTYKKLDVILVDDGSEDRSGKICDEYLKVDPRIRVIHKKNGGLSDARNSGIKISIGKYITFVDSDDYVDNDYIEFLYNLIKKSNSDISICNPIYIYEENNMELRKNRKKNIEFVINKNEALEIMLYQNYFDTSAWGKLYKKDLFYNVNYPVGFLFEDMGTTYKLIDKCKKIIFNSNEKYYYLQRNTSIMGSEFNVKKLHYIEFSLEVYNYIRNNNYSKELINAASSRVISACCSILSELPKGNSEFENISKKIYVNIVNMRKGLLLNKNVRKKNKVIIIISYLGYEYFIKIFSFVIQYNKRKIK